MVFLKKKNVKNWYRMESYNSDGSIFIRYFFIDYMRLIEWVVVVVGVILFDGGLLLFRIKFLEGNEKICFL